MNLDLQGQQNYLLTMTALNFFPADSSIISLVPALHGGIIGAGNAVLQKR